MWENRPTNQCMTNSCLFCRPFTNVLFIFQHPIWWLYAFQFAGTLTFCWLGLKSILDNIYCNLWWSACKVSNQDKLVWTSFSSVFLQLNSFYWDDVCLCKPNCHLLSWSPKIVLSSIDTTRSSDCLIG